MATATIQSNLSRINDADSATDWSSIGGGPGASLTNDIFIQGAGAIGRRVSLGGRGFWYDNTTGIDMTVSGNEHLWMWINLALGANLCKTLSAGGLRIRIGSTAANYNDYYVGGGDVTPTGRWVRYCLDINSLTASATGGTGLDKTSCQFFGVFYDYDSAPGGNIPHVVVDAIDYGNGIAISGGTSGDRLTWADINAVTESNSNALGIVQELANGTYMANGDIQLGYGSVNCYLDDEAQVIVWQEQFYYETTLKTSIDDTFHGLTLFEDTGITEFTDGTKVGSGDTASGRDGTLFKVANATLNKVHFDADDADLTDVSLYGTQLVGLTQSVSFCADATNGPNHEVLGVTFAGCAQIALGRVVIRNSVFSGYTSDTNSALLWNANVNIKNCAFLGNTDGTNDPHAVEHDTAGTFTYDGLTFSGNDYDINNSSSATEVDSYPDTNGDTAVQLYSGATERIAQSFVGTAGKLSRAIFSLQKVLAPTGNVVAKLYADTGGSGPGTLLATSEVVDIVGIGTSWAQVEFEFEDEYTLVAATTYWISVEYSDGDSSNRLEVEVDSSSPGHSGSCYTYNGSWGSQTYDMCFYVNRDGIVIVNATNGADPGTAEETASVKGATIINNTKTLFVSTKNTSGLAIPDVNVRIETDPGKVLLSEGQTDAGGEYTDATYNYLGDEDVKVVARKKGLQNNFAFATIESTGLSVPFTMLRDKSANMP